MTNNLTLLDIINKIKQSGLIGRGGAGYPTGIKWEQMTKQNHKQIYMIVNGSEGETGTSKDGYILKHYLDDLIRGIKIGYQIFPQTVKIYIYLRKDYFDQYQKIIEEKTKDLPIIVFCEPGGYLCGENTVLINSIEGKRLEPRRKPPYCSEVGLWGLPTLVNNLETFYQIAKIVNNKYNNTRLYSISGEISNPGVFDLSNDLTISQVLDKSNNKMSKDQFVQVGGGASGQYFLSSEIANQPANLGTGAIIIYNSKTISFLELMMEKLNFLLAENCGKCTPCREGLYRLMELTKANKLTEKEAVEVIYAMLETSFCGLGTGAGISFTSLWRKKDKIWTQ